MKKFLVVVDKTDDDRIAKLQDFDTQGEADKHLAFVLPKYQQAFILQNPPDYVQEHTTVDMAAKTIAFDEDGYNKWQTRHTWENEISETDLHMPRHMEDLITENSSLKIHKKMKQRYDEKVALRATKPKE